MELDIMIAAKKLDYPDRLLKVVLKNQIKQTGNPFLNLQSCIDSLETTPTPKIKINNKIIIIEDPENMEDPIKLRNMIVCKICMDKIADIVLLPCCHMLTCGNCTLRLTSFPLCNKVIYKIIKYIRP